MGVVFKLSGAKIQPTKLLYHMTKFHYIGSSFRLLASDHYSSFNERNHYIMYLRVIKSERQEFKLRLKNAEMK